MSPHGSFEINIQKSAPFIGVWFLHLFFKKLVGENSCNPKISPTLSRVYAVLAQNS
jgi:hypothetical protein